MRNKLLASAAAIALAVSIGAASAAEMSMLKGISAEPMTAHEMALVQGQGRPTAAFLIDVPSAANEGANNSATRGAPFGAILLRTGTTDCPGRACGAPAPF